MLLNSLRNERKTGSQIAKELKANQKTISNHLKTLEKKGIVKSTVEGKNKYYELKKREFLTTEDIERFDQLPFNKREAIKIFIKELPQQPVITILFGSTATRTYNKDSDIDLLLITNTIIDTKAAEKKINALSVERISVFQMTLDTFKQEIKLEDDPVVQSAIETGYPVTGHTLYYWYFNERTRFTTNAQ